MTSDRSRPTGYSGGQKLLHWVIAIIVLVQIPAGIYMVGRGAATNFDALTNELYTVHKSVGMLILLLMIWRIGLRLARGTPAPVATLTPIQRIGSEAVHGLIYVMLLVVPLLGWAAISAYPARGLLFGLNAPAILGENTKLAETLFQVHKLGAIALAGLIAMHVGAALFHRLVLRDGVLRRMLP